MEMLWKSADRDSVDFVEMTTEKMGFVVCNNSSFVCLLQEWPIQPQPEKGFLLQRGRDLLEEAWEEGANLFHSEELLVGVLLLVSV